jgi:hypothetical protein
VSELADEDEHAGHEHEEQEPEEHEGHEHDEHDEHEGLGSDAEETLEAMLNAIREAPVAQLVVSSISTFASAAYGKLGNKDLPEAKIAIDSIAALIPIVEDQLDEQMRRDLGQALTSLKLAYADAVSSAE